MKTQVFSGTAKGAAEIIKDGGLVAVPTETVYGLAGSGLNEQAVGMIYEVKGRPAIKPLSLMVHGSEAMDALCLDVPEQARTLAACFWPGPLTIVLKAKPEIPSIVLAGGSTVGLRCPDHPLTLELLRDCGLPLAAGINPLRMTQRIRRGFCALCASVSSPGRFFRFTPDRPRSPLPESSCRTPASRRSWGR